MDDLDSPLAKYTADQEPAMAIRGILLATKDGRAGLPQNVQKSLNPLVEAGRLGQPGVEHVSGGVVELLVIDATAQQIAEKQILRRPARQRRAKDLAVELRGVARIRTRTNVDHHIDVVPE